MEKNFALLRVYKWVAERSSNCRNLHPPIPRTAGKLPEQQYWGAHSIDQALEASTEVLGGGESIGFAVSK